MGLAVFVLGVFNALLSLPAFAALRADAPGAGTQPRGARWWITLIFGAVVPALTLLAFVPPRRHAAAGLRLAAATVHQ